MRVPVFKRLLSSDFKDLPLASQLFSVLNDFMQQVTNIFSNFTVRDNVKTRVFSTTILTSSSYTSGNFEPIVFNVDFVPSIVLLTSVTSSGGLITASVGTPSIVINNNVQVLYVPGLQNNTTYNLTFIAL